MSDKVASPIPVIGALKNQAVIRAFLKGLIVTGGLYLFLILLLLIRTDAIYTNIENDLPQRLVPVSLPESGQHGNNTANVKQRPELGEDSPYGHLPAVSENGNSYFKAFRQHDYVLPADKPAITLLITDIGLMSKDNASLLTDLPQEVGVILSSYQDVTASMANRMWRDGREVWIEMPMERPAEKDSLVDAGPKAILSRQSLVNNQDLMRWAMSRADEYIGIAAYSSSIFSKNQPVMRALLDEMFERGIGFLELNPQGLAYFEQSAAFQNAPYLRSDIDLSEEKWANARRDAFIAAENMARDNGHSVVLAPFYPDIMRDLQRWLRSIEGNGFVLAPSSALAAEGLPL